MCILTVIFDGDITFMSLMLVALGFMWAFLIGRLMSKP